MQGDRMDVLLVAPTSPGPQLALVEQEVAAVEQAFGLSCFALRGSIGREQLTRVIQHPWRVVWWAGHGSQAGLALADELLGLDDALQLLRQAQPQLLVLNTCESAFLGLYCHHELRCPVVCTVGPADDLQAYQTGRLLARNLASGMGVADAFARSKPGELTAAQNYRLFVDTLDLRGSDDADDLRIAQALAEWGRRLQEDIARVEEDLSGRLDQQDERLRRMEGYLLPSSARRWSYALAAMLLIAPAALLLDEIRIGSGVTSREAMMAVGLLWALAAVLLSYAVGMVADVWRTAT